MRVTKWRKHLVALAADTDRDQQQQRFLRETKQKKKKKMGWIGENMESIKSLQIRQVLTQAVSLGSFLYSLSFVSQSHTLPFMTHNQSK